MKSSTKRVLSVLISIFLIIGSLFIYSSLILPTYSQIKSLRSEVAGRLNLIEKYETAIDQVKKLLAEYQGTSQIQNIVSSILPTSQNLALAVNQIVFLADNKGLPIEQLSVQRLAIKPSSQPDFIKGIGILRMSFQVSGSYENFKSFLQSLETNIVLMDLKVLKMEPGKGTNNFEYLVVVDTYYQTQ